MIDLPRPLLIGMVHLPALPGAPGNTLALDRIIDHALADAGTLAQAGFGALIVENFGDAPFHAERIEPHTIAAIAIVTRQVVAAANLPVGVNCLRNDARAALAVAIAADARFIRVNVHTGVVAADQGLIEGRAADTLRYRESLGADVAIFADVHVKHATPVSQPDIALAAEETAYRGRADALIVSGATTGRSADLNDLYAVRQAVPDRILLVGSGANADTIRPLLEVADGAIVGTSLKPGGAVAEPIDLKLAGDFIAAARG